MDPSFIYASSHLVSNAERKNGEEEQFEGTIEPQEESVLELRREANDSGIVMDDFCLSQVDGISIAESESVVDGRVIEDAATSSSTGSAEGLGTVEDAVTSSSPTGSEEEEEKLRSSTEMKATFVKTEAAMYKVPSDSSLGEIVAETPDETREKGKTEVGKNKEGKNKEGKNKEGKNKEGKNKEGKKRNGKGRNNDTAGKNSETMKKNKKSAEEINGEKTAEKNNHSESGRSRGQKDKIKSEKKRKEARMRSNEEIKSEANSGKRRDTERRESDHDVHRKEVDQRRVEYQRRVEVHRRVEDQRKGKDQRKVEDQRKGKDQTETTNHGKNGETELIGKDIADMSEVDLDDDG